MRSGGYAYFELPFKIKIILCGLSPGSVSTCPHSWIPEGILLSILFWIAIYAIISLIIYSIKKK
jgi:hypothetical protein